MRRKFYGAAWAAYAAFAAWFAINIHAASAHPQYAVSTVNRYGKLLLGQLGHARLFYTLMIGDVPAFALRQKADRNGDGRLDAAEQQSLAQSLAEMVSGGPQTKPGVLVELNGQPLPLIWDAPAMPLPDPRVLPLAFLLELSAPLPIATNSAKVQVLRYDDHVPLAPIGDVELRLEEAPGVAVLRSYQGQSPFGAANAAPPELLFQTAGPPRSSLSDRAITVHFSIAAPRLAKSFALGSGHWVRGFGIFLASALLLGLALFFWQLSRASRFAKARRKLGGSDEQS